MSRLQLKDPEQLKIERMIENIDEDYLPTEKSINNEIENLKDKFSCTDKPRKLWKIQNYNGEMLQVWNIPSKPHNMGIWNDMTSPTYWIEMEGELHPALLRDISPYSFEMTVKEYNRVRIKQKWGSNSCMANMAYEGTLKLNGRVVYKENYNSRELLVAEMERLRVLITEHPFNFLEPDSEIGRKVWWKRQPAIVESIYENNVILKLDTTATNKKYFDSSIYPNDPDYYDEQEDSVKDSIFSTNIWWFRDND